MNRTVLGPRDYLVMPWKDGGGSTTQLIMEPPGARISDPFLWRLSSARVEASGAFSAFPGKVRILALLSGAGFTLKVAGSRLHLVDPLRPITFPGELPAEATLLQGPVVDLGLIFDPLRVACALEVLELGGEVPELNLTSTTLDSTLLVFAPEGHLRVDGSPLGPMALLRVEGPLGASFQLRAEGPSIKVVVIRIKAH